MSLGGPGGWDKGPPLLRPALEVRGSVVGRFVCWLVGWLAVSCCKLVGRVTDDDNGDND